MPRLMLCPSSAKKPRMLSFPSKSSDAKPPSSKKLLSSKRVVQESYTNSPPSCAKESRKKHTSSQSEHELDQLSIDSIETIDLTGEVPLPSLSTTEPRAREPSRPRNEGAISFQGCRQNRGKKRKSNECAPGLLALSGYPLNIETLSEVNSSPLARNASAQLPATPSRHSPPNDAKLSKGTIANENNDDESSDTWFDIDTIFPGAGLVWPHSHLEATPEEVEKRKPRDSPTRNLYSNDATPPPPCIARDNNPSQPQNPESFPIRMVSSIQQADNSFMKFLAIHSETLAQLMSILKEKLHNNAEVIYQQAIEGRPAPDLIAANKDLVSQIQTMESLQTSRSAYQNCATRKEDFKQSLMRVISEGSDPTTMLELAQSRVFEAEMGNIEAQIRELLSQAKIFDMACKLGIENLSTSPNRSHALE
ncbi:Bloom syndrome protein [Penicillium canescens]|nr:Bloom syndrome protein [Penicillium canescens]KAJ6174790.1 Bloom syndrome protein [Penicillium canescens]